MVTIDGNDVRTRSLGNRGARLAQDAKGSNVASYHCVPAVDSDRLRAGFYVNRTGRQTETPGAARERKKTDWPGKTGRTGFSGRVGESLYSVSLFSFLAAVRPDSLLKRERASPLGHLRVHEYPRRICERRSLPMFTADNNES